MPYIRPHVGRPSDCNDIDCREGEKADGLRALGASEVIDNTETPNWDEKVRELTNARGVDSVVEIGGPGTIAMSLKAWPWADISA